MKKILILVIILLLFCRCINSEVGYRMVSTNIMHTYNENDNYMRLENYIYLSNKVYITLKFPFKYISSKGDVIRIMSSIDDQKINEQEKEKYQYPEMLEDIYILDKNKIRIKIPKKDIKYTYKEFPDTEIPYIYIYTNQKFTGPVTLELGKVKINGEIYNIPPLHLQRYKESASWGLVDDFLMQGNVRNKPLYESGKWLDD